VRVYPPQTIATPLTVIQRERLLPAPGEILVHEGERVEPVQIIGRAFVPAGAHIVNVARDMGVSPSVAAKYIKVKPGQKVKEGEVVAELRGLAALSTLLLGASARPSRSPLDGTVTDSGGGRLLIEAFPREVELRANLYGVVSRVIPNWGAVIRATGALVQGVWGNGKEGTGVLKVVTRDRVKPIRAKSIDASCRGCVLIGGSRIDESALEKATEIQVRGIISGGITPEALSVAETALFPIIVTEGIGVYPMCSRIYQLLSANDGRETTLNAQYRNLWGAIRPEVLIPLPAEPEQPLDQAAEAPLGVGDSVRVVRAPHLGTVGTVTALPVWVRTVTGAQLQGARIETEADKQSILVPLSNLEVLR
jgi:hypothetical protein